MEKRVKLFFEFDTMLLEQAINDFLQRTAGKLHDVKYQYDAWSKEDGFASACLIFTPEEMHEEKIHYVPHKANIVPFVQTLRG
jgi:hypothetical protein